MRKYSQVLVAFSKLIYFILSKYITFVGLAVILVCLNGIIEAESKSF